MPSPRVYFSFALKDIGGFFRENTYFKEIFTTCSTMVASQGGFRRQDSDFYTTTTSSFGISMKPGHQKGIATKKEMMRVLEFTINF